MNQNFTRIRKKI